MARRSGPRLLLLLLRYLVVALGYHRAYGSSAPKDHQVITAIEYQDVTIVFKENLSNLHNVTHLVYGSSLAPLNCYGGTVTLRVRCRIVLVFSEAVLTCQYLKKTMASRLEWKKLGESVSFVYYEQALKGDFKDRAQMLDFNIRIKNVTRNDAGKYRCEVSTPSEQGPRLEEDTVTLEVLVAPGVPSCEIPSSALSGTVVELRCQDKEANPVPEYTWFKDGIRLLGGPELDAQSTNSSYTMNTRSGTLGVEGARAGLHVFRIFKTPTTDRVYNPMNYIDYDLLPGGNYGFGGSQFNTVSKLDSGEYSCEARNSVGSRRCPGKRMQVDDLNISGIIAAVVVVALVISVCGLGVCYAQRKGYFSKETSFQKSSSAAKATTMSENDFKHSKSFII